MWKLSGVLLAAVLVTAGCGGKTTEEKVPVSGGEEQGTPQEGQTETQVETSFIDTEGKEIGKAKITEGPGGVTVEVDVEGLEPGEHGIHIHENGVCTAPDFKASAGGHFNPTGKEHGFDNPKGHHAGDLKNLEVDEDGKGKGYFETADVTLELGKENSLIDDNGTALVIHEGMDDYKTDPAGNSGKPVACAEITSEKVY